MVSGWGEDGIEHLKVLNKNSLVICISDMPTEKPAGRFPALLESSKSKWVGETD